MKNDQKRCRWCGGGPDSGPHYGCEAAYQAGRDAAYTEVERLREALRDIERRADRCYCDQGYPGGCGCGRAIGEMACDARCLTPNEYGACGLCEECKLDLDDAGKAREAAIEAADGECMRQSVEQAIQKKEETMTRTRSTNSRHLLSTVSSGVQAKAEVWYYRQEKHDEVVVEVRDRVGNHIATVQFDLRHPRTARRR